jgi:hypothetical protein
VLTRLTWLSHVLSCGACGAAPAPPPLRINHRKCGNSLLKALRLVHATGDEVKAVERMWRARDELQARGRFEGARSHRGCWPVLYLYLARGFLGEGVAPRPRSPHVCGRCLPRHARQSPAAPLKPPPRPALTGERAGLLPTACAAARPAPPPRRSAFVPPPAAPPVPAGVPAGGGFGGGRGGGAWRCGGCDSCGGWWRKCAPKACSARDAA